MSKVSHAASAASSVGKTLLRTISWIRNIFAVIGVLAVALLVLAFFGIASLSSFNPFSKGEVTMTSTGLGGSFEDIAELATEEYQFTNVGKYNDSGMKLMGVSMPMTGKSFLITYDGYVKAGITDVKQIKVDENALKKEVTINAPRPVAIETKIEPSSVQVYDQSMNPLNQLSVENVTSFISAEEKNAADRAQEKGLIEKAEKNCAHLLEGYYRSQVKGTDKEDYKINVEWK